MEHRVRNSTPCNTQSVDVNARDGKLSSVQYVEHRIPRRTPCNTQSVDVNARDGEAKQYAVCSNTIHQERGIMRVENASHRFPSVSRANCCKSSGHGACDRVTGAWR